MKKIIFKTGIVLFFIFSFLFYSINQNYSIQNDFQEKYNISIVVEDKDIYKTLGVLNDFNEYFIDVYIDSSKDFKINNLVKLSSECKTSFLLKFLSCNSLKDV